jgi:hypothetical protein
MVFVQNVSPGQKVHHILEIRVARHIRLGAGESSITGRPSHAIAHEINRPLEKVLPAVQQLLGLLCKGK